MMDIRTFQNVGDGRREEGNTLSAKGMAKLPVPQPASQTLTPSRLLSESQLNTLLTVSACPFLISNCTCKASCPCKNDEKFHLHP